MIFSETAIHGCYMIGCDPVEDERGIFFRSFDKKEFQEYGINKEFVQHNVSINKKKGTVRGMHFQHPPHAESKLVQCIAGSIFDVVVDLRKNSATFLKWIAVELSAARYNQVLIPECCAHGFQTLEDHSVLLYGHTNYYSKESERGIRADDPLLNITFPLPVSVISGRDKSQPFLDSNFKGLEV